MDPTLKDKLVKERLENYRTKIGVDDREDSAPSGSFFLYTHIFELKTKDGKKMCHFNNCLCVFFR